MEKPSVIDVARRRMTPRGRYTLLHESTSRFIRKQTPFHVYRADGRKTSTAPSCWRTNWLTAPKGSQYFTIRPGKPVADFDRSRPFLAIFSVCSRVPELDRVAKPSSVVLLHQLQHHHVDGLPLVGSARVGGLLVAVPERLHDWIDEIKAVGRLGRSHVVGQDLRLLIRRERGERVHRFG